MSEGQSEDSEPYTSLDSSTKRRGARLSMTRAGKAGLDMFTPTNFHEELSDVPSGWRACIRHFWLFRLMFCPVCLSLKKKPDYQIFCCGCRVWSRSDYCTRRGLALFLFSGGFIAFTFLILLLCYILFGAGIFLAIEPTAFAGENASYGTAIYFVIITISTIGYGDVSLKCTSSRILEFVYVLFGIPMMAVSVTMIASQFYVCLKLKKAEKGKVKNLTFYCRKFCRRCPWIPFGLVWLALLLISAVIFSNLDVLIPEDFLNPTSAPTLTNVTETNATNTTICDNFLDKFLLELKAPNSSWTYGESFYFTYVTLSTIGYGDYLQTSPGGRALVCVLAIVGVGYYALIVSKCGTWVDKRFQKRFRRMLGRIDKTALGEDGEVGKGKSGSCSSCGQELIEIPSTVKVEESV